MKQIIIIFAILLTLPSIAQQSITLEECYKLVAENYPLTKQTQLLEAQNKLDKEVVSIAKLPQLSVAAQATYQSDVIEIPIPNGQRLGNEVIEATGVSKGYGDRLLYENLNFKLPPAGIVGIIGPNGAGKTTLFRMIMGEESPDKGEFKVGETVEIGYVDQDHKDMDPEKTIFEVSFMLGFRSMSYFGKAYKDKFGIAPSKTSKV